MVGLQSLIELHITKTVVASCHFLQAGTTHETTFYDETTGHHDETTPHNQTTGQQAGTTHETTLHDETTGHHDETTPHDQMWGAINDEDEICLYCDRLIRGKLWRKWTVEIFRAVLDQSASH